MFEFTLLFVSAIACALGILVVRRTRELKAIRAELDTTNQILDLIPYSVFWKDTESVYLGCNRSFAQLGGFEDSSELIGKNDFDMVWDTEETLAYRDDDAEVMQSAQPKMHIIETQLTAEGKRTWLDTSKVPLFDKQGRVRGVLGIFHDITGRKTMESELERTQQLLYDAVEAMDSGFVVYGPDTRLILANAKYFEMYGMPFAEMRPNERYEDLLRRYAVHPGTEIGDQEVEEFVQSRLRKHERAPRDWMQRVGDRTIRISDRRTKDGGVVSLRTDVSELVCIQAKLKEALGEAERANQAKTQFLANTTSTTTAAAYNNQHVPAAART